MLEEEEDGDAFEDERNLSSVVRNLSMAPLVASGPSDISATSMDITPIDPSQRRKQQKVKVLPALDETGSFEDMTQSINGGPGVNVKIKKKSPVSKITRLERIQELTRKASKLAGTGDEEEAIKVYKKAIRIAESEVNKLKDQLNRSLEKHPATLRSIQTRIQEDLLEFVLSAGNIKTQMTHLYERTGEYDNAIKTCREAKGIYKKQQKRCPVDNKADDLSFGDSISSGSKFSTRDGSTIHSDSTNSAVVWYVPCPNIDTLLHEACALLNRLTEAQSSYEERRRMVEEILLLRQEISTTFDPKHRKKLYSRVETMTKKFLSIERSTLGATHPQIADTLQLLSDLALEQQREKPGSRDKAIQYLLQGLDINQNSLGKMHPRTGQDLLRMARLYQQPAVMGMSPNDPKRRQDEDRAITYFQQAAAVFAGVEGGQRVVGSILNDLAVIHVARRDFRKALDLLQDSLRNFESESSSEDGDTATTTTTTTEGSSHVVGGVCIDVVQVWRNMGECHVNLKDFGQAIESFVTALDIQRDARQKHDSVAESDLDSAGGEKSFLVHLMQLISDESMADTLRRLGKAFQSAGKYKEAMIVLREAMQIHRAAVEEAGGAGKGRPISPTLPAKLDQLANTAYCIAEVYAASEQYAAAVKIFNESMQLRIASDGHRHETQRCNMIHCAMCLVGIANVHLNKKEYVEAHKLFNDALFFCEAQGTYFLRRRDATSSVKTLQTFRADLLKLLFIRSSTGIPFSQPIVIMIDQRRKEAERLIENDPEREKELLKLEEKAESFTSNGEYDKAILTLSEAMKIRQTTIQKIKAAGLNTSSEISGTARLLQSFGNVFAQKGDDEKAQRAYRDAIRLYEKHRPTKAKIST